MPRSPTSGAATTMAERLDDFRLGPVVGRPSFNEIVRDAGVARIEPQVMNVLLELAKHEGRVVSRDTLIEQCWMGLSVSDDALTRCVSRLRTLLRETDGAVRIETIPKRGYCLRVGHATARPGNQGVAPAALRPSRLNHLLGAGIGALAATASVALLLAIDARSSVQAAPDRAPLSAAGLVGELSDAVPPGADAVAVRWPADKRPAGPGAGSAHPAQPTGGPCRVAATAASPIGSRQLTDGQARRGSPRT